MKKVQSFDLDIIGFIKENIGMVMSVSRDLLDNTYVSPTDREK